MEIYVRKNEEQLGPFTVEFVKKSVEDGRFHPEDLAWCAGEETWRPIHQLIDLGYDKPSSQFVAGSVFGSDDGEDLGIVRFLGAFSKLDSGVLFPLKVFLKVLTLRKSAVRWIFFFGLAPLVTYSIIGELGLRFREATWVFFAYFCIFWLFLFHRLIAPKGGMWKRGIGYALLVAVVGMPLVEAIILLLEDLPITRNLIAALESSSSSVQRTSAIGWLVILVFGQEAIKITPLIIFRPLKKGVFDPRSGMFLGFAVGLGLALGLGVTSSSWVSVGLMGERASSTEPAFTLQVFRVMFCFITDSLMQGAWGGIMGWFIARAVADTALRWQTVCVGFLIIVSLHVLNDFFRLHDSLIVAMFQIPFAALSLFLFVAYIMHSAAAPRITSPSHQENNAASRELTH